MATKARAILERWSYDRLLSISEPKRVLRSKTVRGPALDVEASRGEMTYFFNFRSAPSSTGKRQKGFVKFFKPANPDTPLEKIDCEVDCTCPDFKYRWAWAVKQRGSSRVGPTSANGALNRAPRITNPTGRPGLCKHLLALRDFLYGQDSHFIPTDDPDGSSPRLDRLIAATGRQFSVNPPTNQADRQAAAEVETEPGETPSREQRVRDRQQALTARVNARRRGIIPGLPAEIPPPATPPESNEPRRESVITNMRPIYDVTPQVKTLTEMEAEAIGIAAVDPSTQALAYLAGIERLLAQFIEMNRPTADIASNPSPVAGLPPEPEAEPTDAALEVPPIPEEEQPVPEANKRPLAQ